MQLHFEIKILLSVLITINWHKHIKKNFEKVEHFTPVVFIWTHLVATQARKEQTKFPDISFMNQFPEG